MGANIPVEALERFRGWCAKKGLLQYKAIVAALELFYCVPPDLREYLIEGRMDDTKRYLEGINSAVEREMFRVGELHDQLPIEDADGTAHAAASGAAALGGTKKRKRASGGGEV